MTWNYRLILHPAVEGTNEAWYGLHEVYYDNDMSPRRWTVDPVGFVCGIEEGPDGLISSLRMALADAEKHPVLTMTAGDKLVEEPPPGR